MKLPIFFLFFATAFFGGEQALSELVYEIRNPKTTPESFRSALEKIGEHLAWDALDELETEETSVQTLTDATVLHRLVSESPVLVTILRAGLPLNAGVQKVFPNAEVGFIAMSRDEETLKADVGYVALPDLEGKTVILSDTMLATGGSLLDALKIIENKSPKKVLVITAIASKPGVERIAQYNPSVRIFAAAIDPTLNDKGFIVPGLGDAGDRSYGCKGT